MGNHQSRNDTATNTVILKNIKISTAPLINYIKNESGTISLTIIGRPPKDNKRSLKKTIKRS